MDFTCTTEQENVNWSQKAALPGRCSNRTGTHLKQQHFPGSNKPLSWKMSAQELWPFQTFLARESRGWLLLAQVALGGHWESTGSIPILWGQESHPRHSSDPPGCAHLHTPESWALPLCSPDSVHWRQQGWGLNCLVGAVLWTRTLGSSSQAIQHSSEPINNAWIPHMELTPASHSSESQQILLFSFLLCIYGVVGGSGRRKSSSEVLCWSAFTSSSSFFFHSLLPKKPPAWALSEQ